MKMKIVLLVFLAFFSMTTFAQDRCEMRIQKLQERIADLSSQLRYCQIGNPDYREIERLRSENFYLAEQNRLLQLRIDELEGRGRESFYCSAGCVNTAGMVDVRYLAGASALTQLEADLLAKEEVNKKYSCNFGMKTYKCGPLRTDIHQNFCTAACTNSAGVPDQRFTAGGRGRNMLEAEVEAIKQVQSRWQCNFGIKVIACN
jgi:hypothetical protein